MAERDADDIQREIEQARVSLASAVDQIAYRTNPKRVTEGAKQTVVEKAQTPGRHGGHRRHGPARRRLDRSADPQALTGPATDGRARVSLLSGRSFIRRPSPAGSIVAFRLTPRDSAFYGMFTEAGQNVADSADALAGLLDPNANREAIADAVARARARR